LLPSPPCEQQQRSETMRDLSEKGRVNLDSAAARQGIDPEAAFILLESLSKGGGQ
jgi:hypothetical protein